MIVWIDAHLSPALAPWITETFDVEAYSLRWLGLDSAMDHEIFQAARESGATVMTKDGDFVRLVQEHGPPPQVILISLGNTSNQKMKAVLRTTFTEALRYLGRGEVLVEIQA